MNKQMLYLMKNELGLFKIGISKNPSKRRNEIKNASGVNVELIKAWETTKQAASVERKLHTIFANKRTHGEWFTELTIDDVESNIDSATEWKPTKKSVKINNIKVHQIENNKTPLCELLMEKQLVEMTRTIPVDYAGVKKLEIDQTLLLIEITSIKAKRKEHDGWMKKFLIKNHIVACSVMGSIEKIERVYWDSYGNTLTSSTPMPWFTTRDGALAAAKAQRDSWMVDIMNRFDRAITVIENMPSS